MKWYLAKDLAGLPGLPKAVTSVSRKAVTDGWDRRQVEGVKGRAFEYNFDSLPEETQKYLINEQAKAEMAEKAKLSKEARAAIGEPKKVATSDEKVDALSQMNGWTEERKNRCFIRYEIIRGCEEYIRNVAMIGVKRTQASADFCDMFNARSLPFSDDVYRVIGNMSHVSLRRWRKHYAEGGIANLDRRANPTKEQYIIETQPEMKKFALAMIHEFPHINGGKLAKAIEVEFKKSGLRIPGSRSVQRWLNWWKEHNPSLFESVRNPDAWKNNHLTAYGDASDGICELNQLWELDATPADMQVTLPDGSKRRYHISGLIDVYSRTPMLLVTETPRTEANAALLRRAILEKGRPHRVKLDNGSDYISRGMMMVLDSLDIEFDICPPFSPWKKPHIERFFRSFSHDLLEFLPGFIGHNVAERKAIEARRPFAERLMKKDEVIDVTMSPEDLQEFCDNWVKNVYMHKVHSGIKAKPFDMVNNFKGEIVRISNERALDQLLSVPTQGGTRTVNKKGIKIDNINYIAPELALHTGEQIQIRYDKDDLGKVIVSALNGEFICVAVNPEYEGIDRQQIATEGRRIQREQVKQHKREMEAAKRKYKTREIADRIMDSAEEDASKVIAMPKPGTEFTNKNIEGATEAAEALESNEPSFWDKQEKKEAMRKIVTKEDDTGKARFCRWLDLNKKVEAGEVLDEINRHWKENYEQSPEFKGNYMVWEDFGDRAFR